MPRNGATETACLGPAELSLTLDTVLRELHVEADNETDDGDQQLSLL